MHKYCKYNCTELPLLILLRVLSKPLQELILYFRSSLKYYNKYFGSDIVYNFAYHTYSAYSHIRLCFNHNFIKHPLIL